MFDSIDWASIFAIDTPLLEIFARGSCIYLSLFLMMRFILSRQTGGISITDILLIVLIADAAQNGMADDYKSVTDGLLLVATIMFWGYALDTLSYYSSFFNWLVNPREIPLIKNGRMMRKNMEREMITEEELLGHLREKGVDDAKKVKSACIESGGEISVVTYGAGRTPAAKRKKQRLT